MMFLDRRDAGLALAAELEEFAQRSDVVVLGVPRGGAIVAAEVATELSKAEIDGLAVACGAGLERAQRVYRDRRPPIDLTDKTVILVDDGLATGTTMRAACKALQATPFTRLIAAVPVGSRDACRAVEREVDRLICAETPEFLLDLGIWYEDFSEVTERDVCRAVDEARAALAGRFERPAADGWQPDAMSSA